MHRRTLSLVMVGILLGLNALAWGAEDDLAEKANKPRVFRGIALGPDPGQPDTVFTTVDAPLVIPNGGGDVIIKVWGKTDNTGTGNDIKTFSIPLIVRSSNTSAQVYVSDTSVAFTFNGSVASGWDIKSISVDSNHFNLQAINFFGGFTSGTHLLAQVKLKVSAPCTLSVDTLLLPLNPDFTFGTSNASEYRPEWKPASYPVSCPTCSINQAPVLALIGPKSVAVGESLIFKVHAADLDSDPLVLTATGFPANSSFEDSGNGCGSFTFIPQSGQAGVYQVKFKASDGSLADSEIVQITVTEGEDQPPLLAVSLDQTSCWPPNHKMVSVTATIAVNDDRDPDPEVVLLSVTSDEPDDAQGGGDGHTTDDIQDANLGTIDLNFSLRCERQGGGDGRTYRICYRATDNAGNSTTTCATFEVPHDQGDGTGNSAGPGTTAYLEGNKPNPFNATTTISFNLPQAGSCKLSVYNLTGGLVKEFSFSAQAGSNSIIWDGTDRQGKQVASGVYFYRLQAGTIMETRKMVLLR